jgi:hypothetical protein
MAHVSIFGTGNMGQAISTVVTNGGNTVESFNQSGPDTPVTGDIVVLAVPYPAVADLLAKRGAEFAGKVVVDITNPLNFETFDALTVPADGSAAAEIAAREVGHVAQELLGQRLVKPVLAARLLDLRSSGIGPRGQYRGIRGRDIGDDEGEADQAEQHQPCQRGAAQQVGEHQASIHIG